METGTGNAVRVQLGNGRHYWPGFINCDSEGRCDQIMDVRKLDFPDDSVSEIYAIHLFEHISRLDAESTLLEWKRALKVGGKLVLELPCLDKMAQMIVDGETNIRLTLLGIFGDPREKSKMMLHQWAYTKKELTDLFLHCGFRCEVSEPVYHLPKRDMRITGIKL